MQLLVFIIEHQFTKTKHDKAYAINIVKIIGAGAKTPHPVPPYFIAVSESAC
jgi:hypothetical protein